MSATQSEYDVIVVGGGGSGLAAAISAAKAGARTILLEKNAEIGGSTGMSIGSITSSGTRFQKKKGVTDTPDEHFVDMGRFLGPLDERENKELRRILVDNVPETLEWLMSLGLRFFGPMPEPPHTKPRMHNVLPNSRAYPYVLGRAALRAAVNIRTNARVQDLVIENGVVKGVGLEQNEVIIARGGVILTTGDFSASADLKRRFLPHVAHVDALNPANTGDGQRLGEAAGGHLVNSDVLWGPSLRFAPTSASNLIRHMPAWPSLTKLMEVTLNTLPIRFFRPLIISMMTSTLAPEPSLMKAGAILVNRLGQRFANELAKPELEIPKQPEKVAYIIFDDEIADRFQQWPDFVSTAPGIAYAYIDDYKRQKNLFASGHSPEDLAAKLNIPAAALRATLDDYIKARAISPSSGFHAIGPVYSWVVLTEGGLAVSSNHEVLDANKQPIPGLYAAGSAGQGGLILAGHGHHLGWAFTSGRRAGAFAARRSKIAGAG